MGQGFLMYIYTWFQYTLHLEIIENLEKIMKNTGHLVFIISCSMVFVDFRLWKLSKWKIREQLKHNKKP